MADFALESGPKPTIYRRVGVSEVSEGRQLGEVEGQVPETTLRSWRRVLVFRCCRTPQFRSAVVQVRQCHPQAEIIALTHVDFIADVLAAGANQVISHRATHFTVTGLGPRLVMQLLRGGFDAVVLPLMSTQMGPAANLLRLATLINPPSTAIVAGERPLRTLTRGATRRLAALATLRCPDSVVTLAQMVRTACRRPPRVSRAHSSVRVLHIINSLGMGGAQTQCLELINRMPAGFEIELLVLADDDFSRGRLGRDDVRVAFLGERNTHEGTLIDEIEAHCRRGRYDVVHTWLPDANIVGAAGARRAGVGRIVTSIRAANPGNFPQWRKWWYRPGDVLSARIADVVTVNARALVRDHAWWALMNPRRIEVVHNGLEPSTLEIDRPNARLWLRTQLGVADDVPLIGCVGRLSSEKDQATFLRALGRLRDAGQRFHAVLVGDGPTELELRALAASLHLGNHLTFLGARADARRVMAGVDLLALTSLCEGFPNVLLEAGFLGVPTVATDAGGVREVVGEPEGICKRGNAAGVADALSAALRDPRRAADRARRQAARCRRMFTAEHMVNRWISLYGLRPE